MIQSERGITMRKKYGTFNSKTGQPTVTDDLKLINGIGPAVEKRLHGVGIFTFAQLAVLSSADIAAAVADLNGLSAERITKQDWLGQARKLVPESVQNEAQQASILYLGSEKSASPLTGKPMLTGTLLVPKMEIKGVASTGHRRSLVHNEPFDVNLFLDLSELLIPDNTQLHYKVSLYGKNRGRSGLVIGEAIGTIEPSDNAYITVEGNILPEKGIYQLTATVILGLPTMKLSVRPGTTAIIDGGLVDVC
jgi:hypothetical protein